MVPAVWIIGGVAAGIAIAVVLAFVLSGILLGLIVLVAGAALLTSVAFLLGLFRSG